MHYTWGSVSNNVVLVLEDDMRCPCSWWWRQSHDTFLPLTALGVNSPTPGTHFSLLFFRFSVEKTLLPVWSEVKERRCSPWRVLTSRWPGLARAGESNRKLGVENYWSLVLHEREAGGEIRQNICSNNFFLEFLFWFSEEVWWKKREGVLHRGSTRKPLTTLKRYRGEAVIENCNLYTKTHNLLFGENIFFFLAPLSV